MLKIDEMFAFVAIEDDGEGLCAFKSGDHWLPMVGADMKRVEQLRPIAQDIARMTGQEIRLIKFTARHEIEAIKP